MNKDTVIVFDLETTGCNPISHQIIEIGAIKVTDGSVVEEFSQLIHPRTEIPAQITNITGITEEMVADMPSIEEILPKFLEFCGHHVILGHNISFDYGFMKAKCIQYGYTFERHALDTLALARRFLKALPSRSLGALCEYYQIELTNAHRASHDAKATYALFTRLKEQFAYDNPECFIPKPIFWNPPRQEMITERQKSYLQSLVRTHKKTLDKEIDAYTKPEASRMIDQILREVKQKSMIG